jgi:hypothetical protein
MESDDQLIYATPFRKLSITLKVCCTASSEPSVRVGAERRLVVGRVDPDRWMLHGRRVREANIRVALRGVAPRGGTLLELLVDQAIVHFVRREPGEAVVVALVVLVDEVADGSARVFDAAEGVGEVRPVLSWFEADAERGLPLE